MLDLLIIGAGPAGLTAGMTAARGGLNTLLCEAVFAGGQTLKAENIENFPGFPEGISGFELTERMTAQVKRFGLPVKEAAVTACDLTGDIKRFAFDDGSSLEAKAVIIATGASPRQLGLENERRLTGKGVSYCANCDGAFFKGKDVAVVGGGDTALTDALYLSSLCRSVTVIHRRDTLRAQKRLQDAAFKKENVRFLWNRVPTALIGEEKLTGVKIADIGTGAEETLPADGLFVAVGIRPATGPFAAQLTLTGEGFIPTGSCMETEIPGVFAAGDVRQSPIRQVVTACADGTVAAAAAIAYLSTHTVTVI